LILQGSLILTKTTSLLRNIYEKQVNRLVFDALTSCDSYSLYNTYLILLKLIPQMLDYPLDLTGLNFNDTDNISRARGKVFFYPFRMNQNLMTHLISIVSSLAVFVNINALVLMSVRPARRPDLAFVFSDGQALRMLTGDAGKGVVHNGLSIERLLREGVFTKSIVAQVR
jgi:hypothetical protein